MSDIPPITDDHFGRVDLAKLLPNNSDEVSSSSVTSAPTSAPTPTSAPAPVLNPKLCILAGPILRYWGLENRNQIDNAVWRGSISYVTRDSSSNYTSFPPLVLDGSPQAAPYRYAQEHDLSFWRFDIEVPTSTTESRCIAYKLGSEHREFQFYVPSQQETMRTMFYSCNGFSLKVDPAEFPGCLWDDVLRQHNKSMQSQSKPQADNPIHVMLGGGDQLYCDSIGLVLPEGVLESRTHFREEEKLRELIDRSYLYLYTNWYGRGFWQGLAGETHQRGWIAALGSIPSLNIWDDHDIIDGYGTYRDRTMKSPIFRMLGEYAYKYYMLFQQNVNVESDPKLADPSWICTDRAGPYISYPARSIFARLGKHAAFIGLDCRTERRKDQVVSESHYAQVFERLQKEQQRANGDLNHVFLMLGVPIAYPRMVWAENLMSSKLIAPVKWLSRHEIILKGFVNPFDGDVELLDDLNDHWTARHHKRERNRLLHALMERQAELGVRVTILGGDVHLCTVGAFASIKPTAPELDPNFIVCPVSSAIVNTPPPSALADFMNRRNHKHIFRGHVVERQLPIFSHQPSGAPSGKNTTMMAKRNYCLLDFVEKCEPTSANPQFPGPQFTDEHQKHPLRHNRAINLVNNSVRMSLMVEKDRASANAETAAYSMMIPPMVLKKE